MYCICIVLPGCWGYFLTVLFFVYIWEKRKGIPEARPPPEVFVKTEDFQENFQEEKNGIYQR